MEKPVTYPTTPNTTIAVGDRVRSFDFVGNNDCYFVGTVESITDQLCFRQYNITVEYQIWDGKKAETNYCASVHPPVNGTHCLFGANCGVQRILPGEEE